MNRVAIDTFVKDLNSHNQEARDAFELGKELNAAVREEHFMDEGRYGIGEMKNMPDKPGREELIRMLDKRILDTDLEIEQIKKEIELNKLAMKGSKRIIIGSSLGIVLCVFWLIFRILTEV